MNDKLLATIPDNAGHVIEFAWTYDGLAGAYKKNNPSTHWTAVGIDNAALPKSEGTIDLSVDMDLDHPDARLIDRKYDVVIMGDILEHLRDPANLLAFARRHIAENGRLICCIPNMSHASVVERLLSSDICYDEVGLLAKSHLRFLSSGSVFKILLDSGWLPEIRDSYTVEYPDPSFLEDLLKFSGRIGVSRATAIRNLTTYQYVIDGVPWLPPPRQSTAVKSFTVVVPVNRHHQFELNVRRSPGLAEVGAQIIAIEGAANAAEALERGRGSAENEWIVYCHQDVYFPRGSGIALCAELASVGDRVKSDFLMGFAGIDLDSSGAPRKTGLVIDRTYRLDYPASREAISLDELAIVLHRDGANRIDPWATDLCLQGLIRVGRSIARTTRIPIFHNSFSDYTLPDSFHASVTTLVNKYPQFDRITTLCVDLKRDN